MKFITQCEGEYIDESLYLCIKNGGNEAGFSNLDKSNNTCVSKVNLLET